MSAPRTLTLLGSTGSIGTQAEQVIRANPEAFTVRGVTAAGTNPRQLAHQAIALGAEQVGLAREDAVDELRAELSAAAGPGARLPQILTGPQAAEQIAGNGADVVLNGITGSIGLRPTLAALAAGSTLALANKESLIVGGRIVTQAAAPGQIVPVDSEHSAIAQCLRAGRSTEVRRLILTASGGPFRGRPRAELAGVTPAEALKHPNFAMGRVVTTNSATLVNKGLEVIEAHLLFDIPIDAIEVVVHPQQQIHSMVEFHDGSTIAQAGPPRMLVPIALGLSWPDRLADVDVPCDWTTAGTWEFQPLDNQAFPAVALARRVGQAGGTHPAVYNAANEVCVDAFHEGHIGFLDIVDTLEQVVAAHESGTQQGGSAGHSGVESGAQGNDSLPLSVDDVLSADQWARAQASAMIDKLSKE